jgi:hypothetical protein
VLNISFNGAFAVLKDQEIFAVRVSNLFLYKNPRIGVHFEDIRVIYLLKILAKVAIVINLAYSSDIHFDVVEDFIRRLLLHLLGTFLTFQPSNINELEFLLKRLVFK